MTFSLQGFPHASVIKHLHVCEFFFLLFVPVFYMCVHAIFSFVALPVSHVTTCVHFGKKLIIYVYTLKVEQLGCEGKVEEAQGVMKLCDQLKSEREMLQMVRRIHNYQFLSFAVVS